VRGVCRECGCNEEMPCMGVNEFGDDATCAWTDESRTLCTACVPPERDDEPLVEIYSDAEASAFLREGRPLR
jgi:hypothetical protein